MDQEIVPCRAGGTGSRRLRVVRPALILLIFGCAAWLSALAQEPGGQTRRSLTAADYAQAEKFMSYNASPLVLRAGVRPTWLPGDRFWYRNSLEKGGSEFILVDPARARRAPAFDHGSLATALSTASGKSYDASHLPFTTFNLSPDGRTISFRADGKQWSYDVKAKVCQAAEGGEEAAPAAGRAAEGSRFGGFERDAAQSPDGRFVAFVRDDNLWVREVATKTEKPLTTDGVKDFGYATDNAGWARSDRPVVLWSPDSKKIATFQQDQRGVGEMYLVETRVGHPTLQAWKYPLPGDDVVTTIQRVIINLEGARVIRLKMRPDQHRSTVSDDIKARGGTLEDAQWSPDGTRLAFVSTSRDHKQEILRVADAETGEVRDVLEEKVGTQYESGGSGNWRFLPASNEVIWFSERDDWGQLYLYDLQTGKLKNQITSGEGNVTQIVRVDEKARVLCFVGVGGQGKGSNPYFRHFFRIGFDGRNPLPLTPEDADHEIALSPSGRFFVDVYSRPDVPPVAVLRNADGRILLTLETADISPLVAAGWKPPMTFTVKARDGVTDLYGLMFRPANFDPSKRYPIVNNIYPGPQSGSISGWSFTVARGDCQSLAELGFVIVQIDGMGTPGRSKKFHDAYYGNMGDNTLPDQVTGMKQLAERYPWIDIDRAGIYGHSGGGYATCDAMLRYPDFFKVGVSQAGNHDNREYEDDWGERYQGLLVRHPDGTTNYDDQANQSLARNLKGKLLLAHGTTDSNVPPYNTLLVVNELIRANKDFDLIMFPNRSHGFGSEPYMVRRRWDYFVRWLLGAEPPKDYELKPSASPFGPRR